VDYEIIKLCPSFYNELYNTYKFYVKVKVKVKFTLEQDTKAQRGSRGTALLFL
jgi:hypothetical protein